MGVIDGNPIICTSGTSGTLITNDARRVNFIYWEQPDLSSTSSLILRKGDQSGQVYLHLTAEVSGASQTLKMGMWMDRLFVDCIPSGTVYIYTH